MNKKWIKYRREDFGYLVHVPGKLKIYSHEAEPFLKEKRNIPDELEQNTFKIPIEQFHLSGPVYAFIELTQACNLDCRHCYNKSGIARENELSTQEVIDLLDELAKYKTFYVFFTGGEPLLRDDIAELMTYADQLGMEVGIFTNGMLLTKELIESLPLHTAFGVSLDGIESHERMRPGITFEDVLEKIKLLEEAHRSYTLITTINSENLDELERIFRWSLENGVMVSPVDCLPIGRAYEDMSLLVKESDLVKIARLVVIQEQTERPLDEMIQEKNLPSTHFNDFFDFTNRLESASRRCKGGRAITYVNSNGDVYPCSNCASADMFKAGNLRTDSFTDIWENSFRDIRSIRWRDFSGCKTCHVEKSNYFCDFRCPALSKNLHGDPFVCGATDYIRKAFPLKILLHQLMQMGVDKGELLKKVENMTNENIIDSLYKMVREIQQAKSS